MSLLNKNPTRRIDLGVLSQLLQCAVLWSEADTLCDAALPDDVLHIVDDIRSLIFTPTEEGEWWTEPWFDVPWWENPPPAAVVEVVDGPV